MAKKLRHNIYALGGWSGKGMINSLKNASGSQIAGAVGGAANLAGGLVSSMSNTTEETPEAQVSVTSKADLLNQINSFNGLNLGREKGNGFSDVLSGLSSGLQTGSVAGPMGAVIGGATGGILSGIFGGWGRRRRNAKRRRQEEGYNAQMADQFDAANEELNIAATSNVLSNYSAYGGSLYAYGGNFNDGLTTFGNGGSHEENPNGGILQGTDDQNNPNLVEEGETKWNNYIFSNRLKPGKDFTSQFNLPKAITNKSYAKASEYLTKDAKERPYDPISRRGINASLGRLRDSQESLKAYEDLTNNTANDINMLELGEVLAKGGGIHIKPSKKGTFTAAATKHGKSVQAFANQVLANKENYSPAMVKKANFAKNAAKWHALGGPIRNVQNRFNVMGNQITPFAFGGDLPDTHFNNYIPGTRGGQGTNVFANGDELKIPEVPMGNLAGDKKLVTTPIVKDTGLARHYQSGVTSPNRSNFNWGNFTSQLGLFTPAITNIGLAASAMNESPEQYRFDRVAIDPSNKADVNFPYKPIDREYIANKIRSQAGGTRRGIINTSGGNRATAQAGLLSADRNFLNAIGDAYFKADDVNYGRFIDSKTRSNQAKLMNAQNDLRAQMFNAQVGQQEIQANAMNRAAARNLQREAVSKIGDTFGDVSRYMYDKNVLKSMFPYTTMGEYRRSKGGKIKTKK